MTTTVATFEAGTNGNTVVAGTGNNYSSVSIGAGSGLTFSNAHPAHGTLAMRVADASGVATYAEANTFNSTQITDRFYVYFETVPSVVLAIVTWRTAVGQCGNITVTTGGKLQIQNSAGSNMSTAAAALSVNTLYRIECQVFSSATVGTETMQYYAGDSTTPIESLTPGTNGAINTRGGNITTRRVGKVSTGAETYVWHIDDDLAVDGSLSPLGPSPTPLPILQSRAVHRASVM